MAAIGNSPTQQAFTPAIDYFSGNGSTTAFTLSRPVASVAQVQVTIDNVAQNPSSAYTVSSNTITFTSAPLSGTNNIYVYYTSPITQVIAPGQGTVTSESFGTITNFTTTGNTVLGDATTDTLTVGVTGIVKDSSGNVGIGTASPTALTSNKALTINSPTGFGSLLDLKTNETLNLRVFSNASNSGLSVKTATPLLFDTNDTERMRINSSGNLLLGTTTSVALITEIKTTTEGDSMHYVSGAGSGDYSLNAMNSGGQNAAAAGIKMGKNSSTSRSINAAGTINASGADYAEYMVKAGTFTVAKGDVVGINARGKLTNVFADAISFVVKSTDPSYVGGDVWGNEESLGLTLPKYLADDATDAEKSKYASDKSAFETALEVARQTVDRIAFSGQVPVNVTGATAGQYIIPVNDNGAIKGQAVTSPTFEQYQIAVGKVIAIESDGRAKIIVKVA